MVSSFRNTIISSFILAAIGLGVIEYFNLPFSTDYVAPEKTDIQQQLFDNLRDDDYAGALATLKQIRERDKALSDDLLFIEAKALYETGELKAAKAATKNYLSVAGKNGEYYQDALDLHGRIEFELIDEAAKLEQDLLASRIKAELQSGKKASALKSIQEYMDLSSDPPDYLHYYQGLLLLSDGKMKDAKAPLQTYLDKAGSDGKYAEKARARIKEIESTDPVERARIAAEKKAVEDARIAAEAEAKRKAAEEKRIAEAARKKAEAKAAEEARIAAEIERNRISYELLTYEDGATYRGRVRGGNRRDGYGVYKSAAGTLHEGQWENDQTHGPILITTSSGDKHYQRDAEGTRVGVALIERSSWDVGFELKDGDRHGVGYEVEKVGNKREFWGSYENGSRNGPGVFHYKGKLNPTYKGMWQNGKRVGYGIYYDFGPQIGKSDDWKYYFTACERNSNGCQGYWGRGGKTAWSGYTVYYNYGVNGESKKSTYDWVSGFSDSEISRAKQVVQKSRRAESSALAAEKRAKSLVLKTGELKKSVLGAAEMARQAAQQVQ